MKVKMTETVQGADISGVMAYEGITVSILTPGDEFIVSETLGAWLLENRKAEKVEVPKYYGAQTEPELRHDDEIKPEVLKVAESTEEKEPENEKATTENHNRSRRKRNG